MFSYLVSQIELNKKQKTFTIFIFFLIMFCVLEKQYLFIGRRQFVLLT